MRWRDLGCFWLFVFTCIWVGSAVLVFEIITGFLGV